MRQRLKWLSGRRGSHRSSIGLSLVELMVSVSIGMVIVAALAVLFANNSRSRNETERAGRRFDNGRYALEVLRGDIQNAGYFAEFDPRQIALPTVKPDPCTSDSAGLATALGLHVQGADDVASNALPCLSDLKVETDLILLRRSSGCADGAPDCTSLASGDIAFQASSCNNATELGSATVTDYFALSSSATDLIKTKKNCTTVADVRRLLVRIYYIASSDKPGDGIPTLKRAELTGAGWTAVSLVQGIEDMQIEYGLDSNANGTVSVYTPSPDAYQGCTATTAPTCVQHWASAITVKVVLLSRNLDRSADHVDTKTYVLGRNRDGVGGASGTDKRVGPLNDSYKRSVFQEVIRFENVGGRNST